MWCIKKTYLPTHLLTPWSSVIEKPLFFLANQDIPHILWNLNVQCLFSRVSHLLVSWFRSIQYIHPPPSHFLKVHFNIIVPSTSGSPSGLFPWGSPTRTLYVPLFSPIHATFLAHLILDLIIKIVFGEECRLLSSLCSLIISPVPLRPKYWLQHPILNTFIRHLSLSVSDQDHTCTKQLAKL